MTRLNITLVAFLWLTIGIFNYGSVLNDFNTKFPAQTPATGIASLTLLAGPIAIPAVLLVADHPFEIDYHICTCTERAKAFPHEIGFGATEEEFYTSTLGRDCVYRDGTHRP